ncbi:MAG: PA domain protein [Pseudomonadota bacterium]
MKPSRNSYIALLCATTVTAAILASCGGSSNPAATTASSIASNACQGQESWPNRALTAADASKVDPQQFISEAQLKAWAIETDAQGLRATGNLAHDAYIDRLAARLRCAGVQDVHFEDVPVTRWEAKKWSLNVPGATPASSIRVASYAPYSGTTPASGVNAPLTFLSANTEATTANAKGKIVVFEIEESSIPLAGFLLYTMGIYKPESFPVTKQYNRPFLYLLGAMVSRLEQLEAAGAAGGIAILPVAYETAFGTYAPYDGKLLHTPTLFVDRDEGGRLKQLAAANKTATLTLQAQIDKVNSRNIIGYIPGASDELTVINSHTDGTNYIEDNGPDAVVGIAQYYARLPKEQLPRSMMVLLSAGHFTGGSAIKQFLKNHEEDGLVDRIASVVTIEHLGAEEYEPDEKGVLQPTGEPELGAFFMPEHQALADAAFDMFKNADVGFGAVLKPTDPTSTGENGSNAPAWPGEGQYFYQIARIPTANYITGPYYLLNWGVNTVEKTNFTRMRKLMTSFAQMQIDLSKKSKESLRTSSIAVITAGNTGLPLPALPPSPIGPIKLPVGI